MRIHVDTLIRTTTVVVGLTCLGSATSAQAGDGPRPRTPAEFPEPACMTVVDRSSDPTFAVTYTVALDEPEPTPDEVPDGRRLQFLAFEPPFRTLPLWITTEDVVAAEAVGLVDASKIPDREILANSSDWPADAWARITPDDARIPISQAEAEKGVVWDTSLVAPGTYVISGYTWDPAFNHHSLRWGAIKVVDNLVEPAANLPSVFLPPAAVDVVTAGNEIMLEGCGDALDGSVLHLSWAEVDYANEPTWHPVDGAFPLESGAFVIPFVPPTPAKDAINFAVWLRIELEDPLGRRAIAESPNSFLILPGVAESTDTTGGSTTTADTETTGTQGETGGCNCQTGNPSNPWQWLFILVIIGCTRK